MDKHFELGITYYTHGTNPSILFLSGMHGDEAQSARLMRAYLRNESENMPDFVYIPEVSPSAVKAGTRKNGYDHDINRFFLRTDEDPEVNTVTGILMRFTPKRIIDIHEDPERTSAFYLYDTGHMDAEELERMRALVHTTGARLYTGIDDIEDQTLGHHVDQGYISLPARIIDERSGFFVQWADEQFPETRHFGLEIPGKAGEALKTNIIESLVPFLIHL